MREGPCGAILLSSGHSHISAVAPSSSNNSFKTRLLSVTDTLLAAGESIGIHEGPRGTALLADGEPYTSALVPSASNKLRPSGQITYSKGAALLAMLHDLLDSATPGSFQVE